MTKAAKRCLRMVGEASQDGWLWGSAPKDHVAFELGHKFRIDWEQGQKTGFFSINVKTGRSWAVFRKAKKC